MSTTNNPAWTKYDDVNLGIESVFRGAHHGGAIMMIYVFAEALQAVAEGRPIRLFSQGLGVADVTAAGLSLAYVQGRVADVYGMIENKLIK